MSNELWSLYIAGPDDLVAMPSKAVAEAVARNFNAVWYRYGTERDLKVRAVAHVEPWMHGKEAHTKDLREHFYEYADLVLDEDAARFKPAQPVEAVDVDLPAGWSELSLTIRLNDEDCSPIVFIDDEKIGYTMACVIDAVRDMKLALAHPRPTGDVPRYTHLPVDLWEAIAKNSVWLMRNAKDGHYTLDQAIEYQLGAIATGRDPTPTGEQAGEVVVREPCKLCFGRGERTADGSNGQRVRCKNCDGTGQISRHAQPRPEGVPDGWQKIGFIELAALARLMQGSKKAETLFVIGVGCKPQDVYAKLGAAPEVPRG